MVLLLYSIWKTLLQYKILLCVQPEASLLSWNAMYLYDREMEAPSKNV